MTKEKFTNQFTRLQLLFFKKLSKDELNAFYRELEPMSDMEFIKACHEIVKNERFFPSVSCFIKYKNKMSSSLPDINGDLTDGLS